MSSRIDMSPTHDFQGYKLRQGPALPFGASIVHNGVHFSVFSRYSTFCELVLFHQKEDKPFVIIPFQSRESGYNFMIGDVYSMIVFDLDYEGIEYGFRMDGPYQPQAGHRFDKTKYLLDPYCKLISGRDTWRGKVEQQANPFQHRGRILFDDYDWQGDRPLEKSLEELVIYETHVRSFTCHPSSGVTKARGTYAALREKIPYLKELGVNCVELLPIHEFDEYENMRQINDNLLLNYWGYGTLGFFAPKAGYAATGKLGMQVDEFKTLVRDLHANDIEVFLDVVFNHTAEGDERGPYISFRGIDNNTYYLLTPDGQYYNFSGTGNTLNCNNPIVRNMILDCLRYWVAEFHIDGFRFDLASILSRDEKGAPMADPPLLESLAYDPILGKTKLIAEAWDAGGLYQVGSFPSWGRWAEWNGKFRDDIRKFIKGDAGMTGTIAERVQGSPHLYGWRGPSATINFVTCHDGFTLMDTVSYNDKHNEANGWNNTDGGNDNHSWNCGWEGQTDQPDIIKLRKKQIKNMLTLTLLSRGTPMLLAGDEMGNSQGGNNNAYCQDNEISWLNWDDLKKNADLFRYTKNMIAFRHCHALLRRNIYEPSDFSWHGTKAWWADWSQESKTIAFMLYNQAVEEAVCIYAALNSHWEMHGFQLPQPPQEHMKWYAAANTDMDSPADSYEPGKEVLLENQNDILVGARSLIVLVGKK